MLFYKPESYMLPQQAPPQNGYTRHSQYPTAHTVRPDFDPTKGASGDPYKPPVKYTDILRQK